MLKKENIQNKDCNWRVGGRLLFHYTLYDHSYPC